MTSKEQMNHILDGIQGSEYDWGTMMWLKQELEKLIRIAKEEANPKISPMMFVGEMATNMCRYAEKEKAK